VIARHDLRRSAAATLLPGFEGPELPGWLARRLRDGLGGVCLFGSNVVSLEQLRALTDSIVACNPDAVIAIDEEGGDVTRLFHDGGSPFPGNAILGRLDRADLTEAVGREVGLALAATGCNLDFAPDADVNSNADNPVIGTRSFGADAALVAAHTAAWVRGLQSAGVAAAAKHFPGHGDTATDSHLALPTVDVDPDLLRRRDLAPFRSAIAAGTKAVMTSHILLPRLDPENPATLSRAILQGVLREELGFTGLIVSDALDMRGASGETGIPEAAVRALAAGCDLLCIGTANTDAQLAGIEAAIEEAVADGRLDAARVEEAAQRVVDLARQSAAERARGEVAVSIISEHEPALRAGAVIPAFDVQPAARSALRDADGLRLIRVETPSNIAVGESAWGIWAALEADPDAAWVRSILSEPVVVAGGDVPMPDGDGSALAVVIGRDNHRHALTRATIDRLRASGPVVAVDMGWPSDDRAYADIATFGASKLVGEALGVALAGWSS
jgi:beta-N-acetylhexosaminidase